MSGIGQPKKELGEVKKSRCVRVSDNDIELIMKETLLSLQGFIDLHLLKIKNKKKKKQ